MDRQRDYLECDAKELAGVIAAQDLSAEDLMAATLDRIEALNPRFNAIVALRDRETLLSEAREKDEAVRRGAPLGPLHGLPIAIKELVDVQGLPTTAGFLPLKGTIAGKDGLMTARIRSTGALIIGKTNVPEFGMGSYSFNPVYGATHNAYDERLSAGGSSSGAAVALALRMLSIADGSDFGGSLRNPAGWNNVYGFRPSAGVTPREEPDAWTSSMLVLGPMARSVEDLALLLSVQAGYDELAPLSLAGDGSEFLQPLGSNPKGKRIAWLGDWGGAMPCEPGVLDLARSAMAVLENLGCVVEEARPDFVFEELWRAFVTLRQWHNAPLLDLYREPHTRALLPEAALSEVENGLKLSAYDVARAAQARTRWSHALLPFFARYDAFALPTAQVFAFDVDSRYPTEIAGRRMTSYHEWMRSAVPAAMAGAPAVALPAGFDSAGRAMGVQLVGRPRDDLGILKLAHAYDLATRWPRRRPPPALN
jgi:amidase